MSESENKKTTKSKPKIKEPKYLVYTITMHLPFCGDDLEQMREELDDFVDNLTMTQVALDIKIEAIEVMIKSKYYEKIKKIKLD